MKGLRERAERQTRFIGTIHGLCITHPFSWRCPAIEPHGWARCYRLPFHKGRHLCI